MLNRVAYILYRLASDLVSLISRAIHALILGGSTAQTLSARAHLERNTSRPWRLLGQTINALFFWQDDHIHWAWRQDVERARYVLSRLEDQDT